MHFSIKPSRTRSPQGGQDVSRQCFWGLSDRFLCLGPLCRTQHEFQADWPLVAGLDVGCFDVALFVMQTGTGLLGRQNTFLQIGRKVKFWGEASFAKATDFLPLCLYSGGYLR